MSLFLQHKPKSKSNVIIYILEKNLGDSIACSITLTSIIALHLQGLLDSLGDLFFFVGHIAKHLK